MQLTGMKAKMWYASRNKYDWSMKQAESIEFLSLDRSHLRFTSLYVSMMWKKISSRAMLYRLVTSIESYYTV